MRKIKHGLHGDAGSIDFVQVIVGLIIVGAACVGTFQALQFGNNQLNAQMRYRSAISIARSCVEYWQGRIHTDSPTMGEMEGNLLTAPGQARNRYLLDRRDPLTDVDDIYCDVRYGKIVAVPNAELGTNKETGKTLTSHFVIRVAVSWIEPSSDKGYQEQNVVEFQGSMVPASF